MNVNVGRLFVRGVIGPLFIGHGAQKLFGKFGGHGPEGTGQFFETLGLKPGRRHALSAGAAEFGGGVLLTLGALTPLAATLVSGTMMTAIRKVHMPKGPWVTEGGYEYNLVLIAAMFAITENGPGALSVDGVLFPRLRGTHWAVLELATAAAGSVLITEMANRSAEQRPPEERPAVAGDPAAASDERFSREASDVSAPGS